jgi:predicted nucleotidyltransferase
MQDILQQSRKSDSFNENSIIRTLKRFDLIRFATLYGSAHSGRLTTSSDLDIAIAGEKQFSVEELYQFSESLQESCQREIDLLDLNTAHCPILKQALCQSRILINLDLGLYAGLIRTMWYEEADWMPNYRMILKQRRMKFLSQ